MDWRRIFGGQRLVGDSGRASGSAGPARDQQGAARERFYMRVRESDNLSATLGWTSSGAPRPGRSNLTAATSISLSDTIRKKYCALGSRSL